MIDFLQEYIKNDNIGVIATAHLVHADRSGIFSKVCQSIAAKFSIGIDFAKNGQAQQLDYLEKPQEYPDYMENHTRKEYRSNTVLGKMYRICKHLESENGAASMTYQNVKV